MRVLNVKDSEVTRGVIGRDLRLEPDLREVTFTDSQGIPHTVYAHRDGPFRSPEEVIAAHQSGDLHDRPEADAEPGPAGVHPEGHGY